MSVSPIKDMANIGYGGYYIPVASWLYIYQETGHFDHLLILVSVALGAVIWHAISRSIFGVDGPERHPKKKLAIAGYSLALMYKSEPGGNPKSIDELFGRILDAFTIRRGVRFIVFFSLCTSYIVLVLYSLLILYELSILSGDLVGSVLFISQAIFLVQGQVFKRFPSVIQPESFKWAYVPEYRRLHETFKEDDEGEEDSLFVDPPYVINDTHRALKKIQYQLQGERMLLSGEYGDYQSEPAETDLEEQ